MARRTIPYLALALLALGACKDERPPAGAPAPTGTEANAPAAVPPEVTAAVEALRFDDEATVAAVVAVADQARPLLRARLADGDVLAVKHTLAAYVGSRGVLPPNDLRLALGRDDPVIRRLALQAAAEMRQGELLSAARDLLADPDPTVRVEAVATIARLDDPRVHDTLLPLLERTVPADGPVADAAARALAETAVPVDAVTPLLSHDSPAVRRRALVVLAGRAAPSTLDAIAALRDDPSPAVQQQALRTLAHFGSGRALDHVRPLATAEDVETRRLGIELLEKFDPAAVRELVWSALTDDDVTIRRLATRQLHRYDGNPALPAALAARLGDANPSVRSAAVSAAQGLARTPGVDALLLARIPKETDPKVFAAMGRAFRERRRAEPAFRALVAALGDAKGVAAQGIAEALHALTGQSFGTDAWAWKDWAARRAGGGAGGPDGAAHPDPSDAGAAPPSPPDTTP